MIPIWDDLASWQQYGYLMLAAGTLFGMAVGHGLTKVFSKSCRVCKNFKGLYDTIPAREE